MFLIDLLVPVISGWLQVVFGYKMSFLGKGWLSSMGTSCPAINPTTSHDLDFWFWLKLVEHSLNMLWNSVTSPVANDAQI